MAFQRENLEHAANEVIKEAESVLEGTPVTEPDPIPAPPTEVPDAPPVKKDDPEVTPMCCGGGPGFLVKPRTLLSGGDSGGDVEHAHDCPNNPNNIAV